MTGRINLQTGVDKQAKLMTSPAQLRWDAAVCGFGITNEQDRLPGQLKKLTDRKIYKITRADKTVRDDMFLAKGAMYSGTMKVRITPILFEILRYCWVSEQKTSETHCSRAIVELASFTLLTTLSTS